MDNLVIKEVKVKSVMTKSMLPLGGYSVNPYVGCMHACLYCYASFMKRFTNHPEPWGTFVDVKDFDDLKNVKKYDNVRVVIGSVTDGYMPIEEKYQNTRKILMALSKSNPLLLICTKSDLVLRDLDILKKMKNVTVSFSINTLDEQIKDDLDKAVSISRRLKAMETLYKEGIRTVCFVSPVLPGLTDIKAIFNRVRYICDLIWFENLNLRGGFKKNFLNYIETKHPHLINLYNEIYNLGNKSYFKNLEKELSKLASDNDCMFVDNETPYIKVKNGHPIIVDYFYHEEVKGTNNTGIRNK